jgi:hypothetical protein
VDDDSGEADTDRQPVRRRTHPVDHLHDRADDVIGLAALRRQDLEAFGHQLAGLQVDDGSLDAGAADVDADRVGAHWGSSRWSWWSWVTV